MIRALILASLVFCLGASADESAVFNGKDLSGWFVKPDHPTIARSFRGPAHSPYFFLPPLFFAPRSGQFGSSVRASFMIFSALATRSGCLSARLVVSATSLARS